MEGCVWVVHSFVPLDQSLVSAGGLVPWLPESAARLGKSVMLSLSQYFSK